MNTKKTEKLEWIAGPCAAESREQLWETALQLAGFPFKFFRAGLWKPRSRPHSFRGRGVEAAAWMYELKRHHHLPIITEVASTRHIEVAFKYEFDALWLGARTTANPLLVEELLGALEGTDIPLYIKNPVNPDLDLWIGVMERCIIAGHENLAAVHRGFSQYGKHPWRNQPIWPLVLRFKKQFPEIPLFCDPSHMCGDAAIALQFMQSTRGVLYDGYMVEVHRDPASALSDGQQQMRPGALWSCLDEQYANKELSL